MRSKFKVFLLLVNLVVLGYGQILYAVPVDFDLVQGQTLFYSYNQNIPSEITSSSGRVGSVTGISYMVWWENLSDNYEIRASFLDSNGDLIEERITNDEDLYWVTGRIGSEFKVIDDDYSGSNPYNRTILDLDPYMDEADDERFTLSIEILQGSIHFSDLYLICWAPEIGIGKQIQNPDHYDINVTSASPAAVPEPATMLLLSSGLFGFFFAKRREK